MVAIASPKIEAAKLVERILAEGPVGASAVARMCGTGRGGRPVHPSTISRWALHGVRLTDGRTLKLEAVRLNGRLMTSRPAFVRFMSAQQQQTDGDIGLAAEAVRSPHARRRASEAAGEELTRMGC